MRRSKYTRAVLAPVVARARSLAEVIRAFGLRPTGGNYRHFKAVIFKAGLDTGHFDGTSSVALRPIRTYSYEELEHLVREAKSVARVCARLGLPVRGRPHREVTRRIRELGLDVSHFRGQGWARGETKETHPSLASASQRIAFPDDQVFVEGSLIKGPALTPRLLRLGWKYECNICGISQWQGRALTLHLDHINGKHYDNRLENLRFLCPNCHSQTSTYSNRAREACYTFDASRAWRNLVDARVLEARTARCGGSSPPARTRKLRSFQHFEIGRLSFCHAFATAHRFRRRFRRRRATSSAWPG